MPRYEDRYGSSTRLYVGHLSSRTRSRDLEHVFSRYGRVRDVDMKRDYAFVEFSDPRDADDARHYLDGRDVDGRRITVEFAKGVPRGSGGAREYVGRGPAPGSGRCFNCGIDGHWARDCKAGDWKNKCYRCGERGHIERDCKNSPKKLSVSHRRGRSYSRSPSPHHGRSMSRSLSRSRSYSRSRSPAPRRGRDAEYEDRRRSRSPRSESPEPRRSVSPVKTRKRSPTPDRDDSPRERSPSPKQEDRYGDSSKEASPSPVESPNKSPYAAANGRDGSSSPRNDRSPVEDDDGQEDNVGSPRGSESPE